MKAIINNTCCDKCGNYISQTLIRPDGVPNGVGFELENCRVITLCADCIKDLGRLKALGDQAGIDAFFDDIARENK